MKALTLYSRSGCHLCARLAEELAPLIAGRAELEVVDIEGDPELEERLGLRIPVLAAGKRELCGYPPDLAALERFLDTPPALCGYHPPGD